MFRRRCLPALISSLLGARGAAQAAAKVLDLRRVATPTPMAQIAAGGPTGLLGVADSGGLWALPLQPGASAVRLGEGIDPHTPLATGHGRVAARRSDGSLWVLEDGRIGVSTRTNLAPAAGLLILPLAVIAIDAGSLAHRAVRLEPAGGAAPVWRRTAVSEMPTLPDARPLQADLDGSGDGGQVVLLAGPDSQRYRHAVLGDAIEATRIVLLERHSLAVQRSLTLEAPHVFEDIAPRRVVLGTRDGLLTVRSGPLGAELVLVDADPAAAGALRVAASGPALGTVNRWMSPITDGQHWLAVHTPHIGGVLHAYRRDGDRLNAQRVMAGVSNHRIGSRLLDSSAWSGRHLLLAEQSGRRVRVLDAAGGWLVVAEGELAARAVAMLSVGAAGLVAVLLDDGAVMLGAV